MLRDSLRRWRHGPLSVWWHPALRVPIAGIEALFGVSPTWTEDVLTYLRSRRVVRSVDVYDAQELSWRDAARVHDPAYLASLDDPGVLADILGLPGERVPVAAMLAHVRRACGATLAAARHVIAHGGRAGVLGGGFHHAAPSRGAGFCVLNDVAIAVRCLRSDGHAGPIVVLDLDAHPPDGIVGALADDPRVHVRSLGVASEWTVPDGTRADVVDRRVPANTEDAGYLTALHALLDTLPAADLVFYIAGADPLVGDPLGGLRVSEVGLRQRDAQVFRAVGDKPTVIMAGGGYTDDSWRVLAGTLAEAAGDGRPVPPGWDPLLKRTRDIAAKLDPDRLAGDAGWLEIAEVYESLGIPTSEPRFLGYYTRHGVEYALSSYGLLERLTEMGFTGIGFELELDGPSDRLRVTVQLGEAADAVLDLSVSRRQRDGFQFLFVEWLELRDPRVSTHRRALLPGQRSPGLGLSDHVMQVLIQAALRTGLQGVAFVPAHYHVAVMASRRFVFLDPEVAGRFTALRTWLGDRTLLDASSALETPGIELDGARVTWEPAWMVLPVDERLQEALAQRATESESASQARLAWLAARTI
ncbi:MAG: acetoin utilization deacetylase AcuC-like enzyme [Myxococcota bacterium]|jgi:acetoin utilization deacetylase AcuC-like enzyme